MIPTNCVVLNTPVYPDEIEWENCNDYPCLNLENAKKLALYLSAVKRYHEHIEEVCKE